jgi:hypothetical protein
MAEAVPDSQSVFNSAPSSFRVFVNAEEYRHVGLPLD